MAFQLMLEGNYNGQVDGAEVAAFEERCKDRWFREIDMALEQPNLKTRKRLELERALRASQDAWKWAVAVLKTIELNHRSVTEAYQATRLAFRSRKIVESHAARYLTRFATAWDIFANDDPNDLGESLDTRCAWDFSNDPQWRDVLGAGNRHAEASVGARSGRRSDRPGGYAAVPVGLVPPDKTGNPPE